MEPGKGTAARPSTNTFPPMSARLDGYNRWVEARARNHRRVLLAARSGPWASARAGVSSASEAVRAAHGPHLPLHRHVLFLAAAVVVGLALYQMARFLLARRRARLSKQARGMQSGEVRRP
jgi:hypothetical protein